MLQYSRTIKLNKRLENTGIILLASLKKMFGFCVAQKQGRLS